MDWFGQGQRISLSSKKEKALGTKRFVDNCLTLNAKGRLLNVNLSYSWNRKETQCFKNIWGGPMKKLHLDIDAILNNRTTFKYSGPHITPIKIIM